MSQNPPEIRVTVTEMRKLFNEGNYQERIKKGEFRIVRKQHKPEPSALRDFGDIVSIGTYCFDDEGFEIVYTHHYESPNGDVLYRDKQTGTVYLNGRMDPKRMLHNGIQYHLEEKER